MGQTCGKQSTTSKIERDLRHQNDSDKHTLKVLLLGAGDSGKTTIFKQLKHSKGSGFTDVDYNKHAIGLIVNIVEGMNQLIRATIDHKPQVKEDETMMGYIKIINGLEKLEAGKINYEVKVTDDVVEALLGIWNSEMVKEVTQSAMQAGKYVIGDTFPILMEKLSSYPEWGGPKWKPSVEDCMLWRSPTTGIEEQFFQQDKTKLKIIDVGGQRSERRKWIELFAGVNALIYVCSMSEYNQTLYEASNTNRFQETLTLFKSILENQVFSRVGCIIFFNKMDLFEQKYVHERVPFDRDLFPNAPKIEDEDPEKGMMELAKQWYYDELVNGLEGAARRKKFSVHYTSALDTNKMKVILDECAYFFLRFEAQKHGLIRA